METKVAFVNSRRREAEPSGNTRSGCGDGTPGDTVRHFRTAVVAVATASLFLVASAPAHALLESFSVTPASGGEGTEVTVSGTGCSPGPTNTSSDYVMVTATNPVVSRKLSVTNAGAWNGTFSIPSGTPPVVAAIAAACFTNGLPSIVTTYAPQTFTVTAAPESATTTPTTAGTSPATTVPAVISPGPGTAAGDGGSSRRTTPGGNANDPGTGGGTSTTPVTNPDGTPSDGGSSTGRSRASSSRVTASDDTTANDARDRPTTRAANVASAATDFTSAQKNDDFAWLWWMLVVLGLFIAGALAMGLRWRYEERDEPPS
jgi:hypothetical protein